MTATLTLTDKLAPIDDLIAQWREIQTSTFGSACAHTHRKLIQETIELLEAHKRCPDRRVIVLDHAVGNDAK